MDPLMLLTAIAVILLLGLIASAIANKLHIPDVLLLILIGMGLAKLQDLGLAIPDFPTTFVASLGILALAMIVFDSTSRIDLKRIDTLSNRTFRLIIIFLVILMTIFTLVTYSIFGFDIGLCLLFAGALCGTSPSVVIPLLGEKHLRVLDLLKLESLLNTPLTVLIPFFVVDLIQSSPKETLTTAVFAQIGPFLATFVSGLGAGLLIALILIKIIRRSYHQSYSALAVVLAALLSYVLAEQLGGNGVLAVSTLGIFVANVNFKEKIRLLDVESVFARSLTILVFVLVGYLIRPLWEPLFLLKALGLFAVYHFLRFVAIQVAFGDSHHFREKIFMSLVAAKGIDVCVVAIVLSTIPLVGLPLVVDLILIFVLLSIFVSSIAVWAKDFFLLEPKR